MQWNGIKVPVVILALVVGLTSFWGAQWLYDRYNYDRPLDKILGENKNIASYQINDQEPLLEIEIKLSRVDNLQETYGEIYQSLQEILGRRNFRIILQDQRDPTLDGIYYHTRLAAFEALERGNFLEMEGYISKLAAGQGSEARVWLDQDRLYIQVEHGNNYLYEIIPRPKAAGAVNNGSGERSGQS